ncbi:MAG: hypothetical protein ACI8RD_007886 [Bacillariaceae sp.]|jgi:hypothetical protein
MYPKEFQSREINHTTSSQNAVPRHPLLIRKSNKQTNYPEQERKYYSYYLIPRAHPYRNRTSYFSFLVPVHLFQKQSSEYIQEEEAAIWRISSENKRK